MSTSPDDCGHDILMWVNADGEQWERELCDRCGADTLRRAKPLGDGWPTVIDILLEYPTFNDALLAAGAPPGPVEENLMLSRDQAHIDAYVPREARAVGVVVHASAAMSTNGELNVIEGERREDT